MVWCGAAGRMDGRNGGIMREYDWWEGAHSCDCDCEWDVWRRREQEEDPSPLLLLLRHEISRRSIACRVVGAHC